jgi:GST-like protein
VVLAGFTEVRFDYFNNGAVLNSESCFGQLAVLEKELEGKDWITGEYSIADIAIAPWLKILRYYGVESAVGWHDLQNAPAYLDRFLARPAVQRGLNIPSSD